MERNVEVGLLLAFYGGLLTPHQQNIVRLYVDEDYSLREIAEKESITRQGVHDILRRGEAQLREMEEKLGLVKKTLQTRQILENLSEMAEAASLPQREKEKLQQEIVSLQRLWEEKDGV